MAGSTTSLKLHAKQISTRDVLIAVLEAELAQAKKEMERLKALVKLREGESHGLRAELATIKRIYDTGP